jgi:hypothetical protein
MRDLQCFTGEFLGAIEISELTFHYTEVPGLAVNGYEIARLTG